MPRARLRHVCGIPPIRSLRSFASATSPPQGQGSPIFSIAAWTRGGASLNYQAEIALLAKERMIEEAIAYTLRRKAIGRPSLDNQSFISVWRSSKPRSK